MSYLEEVAKGAKTEQQRIDVIREAVMTGRWGLYAQRKLEQAWGIDGDSVLELHHRAVTALTKEFQSQSADQKRAILVAKLHNLADVALRKTKVVTNEDGEFQSYDDPDIRGAAAALAEAAKHSLPKDPDDDEDIMERAMKILGAKTSVPPALPAAVVMKEETK